MKIAILFCCLMLGANLAAVDTPTDVEWAPIKEALDRNDPQVRRMLADLLVNRQWSDGWVQLAELDRQAGDFEALATNAQRALDFAYADVVEVERGVRNRPAYELLTANAAYLAILGANRTGEPLRGIELFNEFGRRADPLGWAHLHAAESHLLASANRYGDERIDTIRAGKDILERGKGLSSSLTPHFFLVEGRLLLGEAEHLQNLGRAGDARANLRSAAISYEQAIELGVDNRDQRFITGQIWHNLAKTSTRDSERAVFLDNASVHYQVAATANGDNDPEAYLALGMVHLEQGRYGDAHTALSAALSGFPDDTPEQRRAAVHHARGHAAMELTNRNPQSWTHQRALDDLLAARDLGEDTPALYNNLLVTATSALGATRDPNERARLQDIIDHTRPLVNEDASRAQAKALYESVKNRAQEKASMALVQELHTAINLLTTDLGIVPGESENWSTSSAAADNENAAVWRFLGLSLHQQAEVASSLRAADNPATGLPDADDIDTWRDQAAIAWRIAGELGDDLSRRHFLVRESRRDPQRAYRSGWIVLSWNSYLSPSAWAVVIGNYGACERWREHSHIAIWAVLAGLSLLLGIKGFFFPKKAAREAGRGTRHERPARAAAPATSNNSPIDDATLLPDNISDPRTDALERRTAEKRKRSAAVQTEPKGAASKSDARRQAVNDVARRLADQQGQGDKRRAPPTRRRR